LPAASASAALGGQVRRADPPAGQEDAGYTYAMILDCSKDRMGEVRRIVTEAVRRSHEKMG
jgi:hypothetical protein